MPTASMCFRNVLLGFPPSYFQTPGGDRFITCMLGTHGYGEVQSSILPCVYRSHAGGTFRSLSQLDKRKHIAYTSEMVHEYLRSSKFKKASKYYVEKTCKDYNILIHKLIKKSKYRLFFKSYIKVVKIYYNNNMVTKIPSFSLRVGRCLFSHIRQKIIPKY